MIALVFLDQNGKRVELFDTDEVAEERFSETQVKAGADLDEYEYEDDTWNTDDGLEACYVVRNVNPPKGHVVIPKTAAVCGAIGCICMIALTIMLLLVKVLPQ